MVAEIHFSVAVGEVCCERCHCAAAPPASLGAQRWREPKPLPRPQPSYAQLVERVWAALELRTAHRPGYLGAQRISGYCPVCGIGTLSISFRDDPPRAYVRSCDGGAGRCSEGCTEAEIVERLG